MKDELAMGIFEAATYRAFMRRLEKTRDDLRSLLSRLQREGKTVWVYGASTKGNTILQYCGLGHNELVAAADANPFKLGKFVVGADLPIKDEAAMRAAKPDYLLALPYSFVEGFRKREAAQAAKIMGVDIVKRFNWGDTKLFDSYEKRVDIARVIRRCKPRIIFTPHWDGYTGRR